MKVFLAGAIGAVGRRLLPRDGCRAALAAGADATAVAA